MRLVSNLKNLLVSSERKPRRILAGPFKDIVMGLSLRSQTQIYPGLFEKQIHPWLNRLSQGIATAIDIGAAHGEYTLYFLQKTRATKVLAFEPDASLLSCLNENLALNGIDQLERLEISTKFVGISNTEHEIRLDSLAPSLHGPCFIKMDVDGAEEKVLNGANTINALTNVRWLIETHSSQLELLCERILTAAGFQIRIIPNARWRVLFPNNAQSNITAGWQHGKAKEAFSRGWVCQLIGSVPSGRSSKATIASNRREGLRDSQNDDTLQ